MNDPLAQQARAMRPGVGGRVAFAAATLFLAAALVALLDRVGAPARLVSALAPAITLAALAIVGLTLQSMRVSAFLGADRRQGPVHVALGLAGLSLALVPPMAFPGSSGSGPALLVGLVVGVFLVGLGSGPLLRKSGAYSLSSLFGQRFASPRLRFGSALVVAAVGALIAFVGFEGAARGVEEHLGVTRFSASLIAGAVLLAVIVPGGLAGGSWSAAGGGLALLAALLAPLAAHTMTGAPLPAPVIGDVGAWAAATARITRWSGGVDAGSFWTGLTILGAALGVAALAPLLSPMVACRRARLAAPAGLMGLLAATALVCALLIGMALAGLTLEARAIGRRPEALPAFMYAMSDLRLMTVCGEFVNTPRAAALACAKAPGFGGLLGAEHVWASGRALMERVPHVAGLSAFFVGLVGAGFIAVAVALAAAGAQTFSTAVGDDLFKRDGRAGLTSRRLAIARIIMILLTVYLAIRGAAAPQSLQNALSMALLLSAAALAPLMALCVWPRATETDALIAGGVGLAACALTAALAWRGGAFDLAVMCGGGVAGFVTALVAGVGVSLRRTEDQARLGRMFVQNLFQGDEDVIAVDKGA